MRFSKGLSLTFSLSTKFHVVIIIFQQITKSYKQQAKSNEQEAESYILQAKINTKKKICNFGSKTILKVDLQWK